MDSLPSQYPRSTTLRTEWKASKANVERVAAEILSGKRR
jgi:hypothetical protein